MLITRAEWLWTIIASILIMVLSTIPYLTGYLSETPELRFGGAVFDRQDYNVYLASIQVGLRGEWQSRMLHSSERMSPAYIRPFYILVGQIGRVVHLAPSALYEATRWIAGLVMLWTLYAFAARFLWAIALRRVAFLIGALGSGIGWLLLILRWQPNPNVSPIDFWLIDLYGFFSLLTFPHFAVVMTLLWSAVLAMLRHWETHQGRCLIVCGICVMVMQMIQPFAPLIVDAVLVGYAVWGWLARQMRFPFASLGLLILVQIPLAGYNISVLYGDSLWSVFARQNITPSPDGLYYVLGLGILGVLAAIGVWRVARRDFGEAQLLIVWLIAVAILVYAPVIFQRRLAVGVSAPLAVLAAMGGGYEILPLLTRWQPFRRVRSITIMLTLITMMISTLFLTFGGALLVAVRSSELFDPTAVIEAIDWLGANSDWGDAVFSAERTGNYIPARTGQHVYLGHQMETLEYARKSKIVEQFFGAEMRDDERWAVLSESGCRFVFWGPYERALGTFRPNASSFLHLVHTNQLVSIFRVVDVP